MSNHDFLNTFIAKAEELNLDEHSFTLQAIDRIEFLVPLKKPELYKDFVEMCIEYLSLKEENPNQKNVLYMSSILDNLVYKAPTDLSLLVFLRYLKEDDRLKSSLTDGFFQTLCYKEAEVLQNPDPKVDSYLKANCFKHPDWDSLPYAKFLEN